MGRRAPCAVPARSPGTLPGWGIEIRIGLDIGECQIRRRELNGAALELARRVESRADSGEVLVSGPIRDLVSGSEIRFEERGTFPPSAETGCSYLYNNEERPMLIRSSQIEVRIYSAREDAGAEGAAIAAGAIRERVARDGRAAVVFASAVSQDPFLAALRRLDVDWPRVTAFHMDEYAGMSERHPASFRRFLRERLFDHVPVGAFHGLNAEAGDLEAECDRYGALLRAAAPSLVIMGIGENGHLAFIDPPACRFDEPRDVRTVDLDEVCRMQQVHDGAFARLQEVPARALSLTVPFFLRIPRALVLVNGERKAAAVRAALEGPVTEACPASALRRHPAATLFLDAAAASMLGKP
jgi:glucosamine-6-phosphate deaminase